MNKEIPLPITVVIVAAIAVLAIGLGMFAINREPAKRQGPGGPAIGMNVSKTHLESR